ncbi:DUF983 domain-containing protein [Pedobacter suwonensis]|uniref:DUF983 domain-containing protein n=3 Tax=Pedobacter suwonensis TaxID=332999 RepID=UPI0036CECAE4
MTKLGAIIDHRCPRCRKGKMYKHSMFHWKYDQMYTNCSCCNLKYEIEPGFFIGAMYVSYVFIVAELVNAGILAFMLFGDKDEWAIIGTTIAPVILLFTFNYRYARTLLLHVLSHIKYSEDAGRNC